MDLSTRGAEDDGSCVVRDASGCRTVGSSFTDECSCAVSLGRGTEDVNEDIDGEVANDDEGCEEDDGDKRSTLPEDLKVTGGESSSFVESSEYARRDTGAGSRCIDVPGNAIEDERALLCGLDFSDICWVIGVFPSGSPCDR